MLMIYLEQLVYAAMSVMTPVISENDALDNKADNQIIYLLGTRYSHMLSLPILFVLFTNGDSFISMWMGQEYAEHGANVLKILSIGYTFYLSQVIANSILKGISRHKVFSYILISQALVNLIMSLALARVYGIEGVALGTTIPLIVANIFIVPFYTCKVLELRYVSYMFKRYFPLFIFTMVLSFTFFVVPIKVSTYSQLTGYSAIVASLYIAFSLFFVLEKHHKVLVFNRIRKIVTYRLSFRFGSGR
jgi:O-antigen/teichoic acid export membrane protein